MFSPEEDPDAALTENMSNDHFTCLRTGGRGTNDFRGLKENIWYASCVLAGTDLRVRAESDATEAVRVEVLPKGLGDC